MTVRGWLIVGSGEVGPGSPAAWVELPAGSSLPDAAAFKVGTATLWQSAPGAIRLWLVVVEIPLVPGS